MKRSGSASSNSSHSSFGSAARLLSAFRPRTPAHSRKTNNSSEFEGDDASRSLFSACKSGKAHKVERIIKKKPAALNGCNKTFQNSPLHLASSCGNAEVVRVLLSHQASVNSKNYEQKTPLSMACEAGALECVELLLQHEATIYVNDTTQGQTPLHATCAGTGQGGSRYKIVQLLLSHNASATTTDTQMWTPLHFAALRGFNRTCKLLLEHQASPTARTVDGETPLALGCNSGGLTVELIEILSRNEEETSAHVLYMDISDRQLELVPPCLARFKNLKRLDLSKNLIEALPTFLVQFESLEHVLLAGNPLNTIPAMFHQESWDKVRQYLLSLGSQTERWKERKLLFVGQEGVGKTTLLKCFVKQRGRGRIRDKGVDTRANLSTDGIDIVEGLNLGDEEVTFNAWDLGGQEIYYPSHQFFLTPNSVYILVFDLARPRFDRMEYWLQLIRGLGHDSETRTLTFLVGTHADDPSVTPEYLQSLRDRIEQKFPALRFPGLKGFFCVSCRSGEGIENFAMSLVSAVKAEPVAPVLAESWIKLNEFIRTSNKEYVTWSEYEQWADVCELERAHLPLATAFLAHIGSLIHFDDPHGGLQDLVVLNPQWLANVMACLVTTRHTFAHDGILQHNTIRHIFAEYPRSIHSQLVALLERFSVLNPLPDKDKSLVPCLLPELVPSSLLAQYWPTLLPDQTIEYGRVREFSFLPLGLFSRIMVAVLHVEGVKGLVFWRNGLLVEYQSQLGLFVYQPEDFTMKFSVRAHLGFRKAGGSVLLLRQFVEITETIITCYYPRLHATTHRFVTCTHCKQQRDTVAASQPFLFTEEEVIQSMHACQTALFCHHIQSSSRCVSVLDLAPDLAFDDLPSIQASEVTVERKLGKGGFGTVYQGTWNGRPVAIKELNAPVVDLKKKGGAVGGDKFGEFQRECWIMSTLLHPNITQLYGVVVHPQLQMVMQFCPQGDLFHLLHPRGVNGKMHDIGEDELAWPLRYRIALDIAKGMRYLQSIQPPVIHRDLRSLNIFLVDLSLDAPVRAQVADFGLSRRVCPKMKGVLGTWQWLAPEMIDAATDQYDQRADVYSFGIVLWEIATAQVPFDEFDTDPRFIRATDLRHGDRAVVDVMGLKRAIIEEELRPSIPSTVPPVLAKLITQCWRTDPSLRPTFGTLVDALSTLAEEKVASVEEEVAHFVNREIIQRVERSPIPPLVRDSTRDAYKLREIFSLQDNLRGEPVAMTACYVQSTQSIWIGYDSGTIGIYSPTGQWITCVKVHTDRIRALIKVRSHLWSAGEDGMIYVWDPASLNIVAFWKASPHRSDVVSGMECIHRSLEGRSKKDNVPSPSAVWSWLPVSRSIRIWDGDTHVIQNTLIIGEEKDVITCLTHCEDMVWVGTRSGTIYLYDAITVEHLGSFLLAGSVQCLTSEGSRVWSASGSLIQVWEWDRQVLRLVTECQVHTSAVRFITYMPSCDRIWTGDYDGLLIVWDVKRCVPLQELAGGHYKSDIRAVVETIEGGPCRTFISLSRNCAAAKWYELEGSKPQEAEKQKSGKWVAPRSWSKCKPTPIVPTPS